MREGTMYKTCCPVSVSIRFGDVATLKSEELNWNALGCMYINGFYVDRP